MTGLDNKLMSIKEVKTYEEIKRVMAGQIRQIEAAKNLGISERQVRRLVKRLTEGGKEGLIHRLRGKASHKKIKAEKKEQIIDICAESYKGFSLTLTQEKLLEIEKICINRESLREMLMSVGLWEPVRKGRKHRQWRERKACYGEMEQLDGSHHDWLEGRGPEMVLMSFIDDATGRVHAEFFAYEGTIPAMTLMKTYIKKYGKPRIVYLDRHSTYKSQREATIEEQLRNEEPMSQFERALKELGIEVIHAYSPQAKGRIERSFRTHQDRLIKEMRLANINTMEEANKFLREYYLPKHNRKFCARPAKEDDMHMPLSEGQDLSNILAIKTDRVVRNDYTVAYERNLYQLDTVLALKGRKVSIVEKLNSKMRIEYKREPIKYSKINLKLKSKEFDGIQTEKVVRFVRKTKYKPDRNHPWNSGGSFQAYI
jgi:transposase